MPIAAYAAPDFNQRGAFTLSLDFELIWAGLNTYGPETFRPACEVERAVVVERLLELFVEFEVPATWCILGHLFLDHCAPQNGVKHPDIVAPRYDWCPHDWFAHDPCGDENSHPLYYARTLVEKIRDCPVPQEIGSHSFSHIHFNDPACTRENALTDLAACVRAARELGIELRSFAFPLNGIGHLDALRETGFTCFRGPDAVWYELRRCPALVKRLAHLWDLFLAAAPPVVLPQQLENGLWNIPGSMIYFPAHGVRRYVPMKLRVKRAVRGLDAAARQKRVFHLWFHPTNMADRTDEMFAGLRAILEHARALRERGQLAFAPMQAMAP